MCVHRIIFAAVILALAACSKADANETSTATSSQPESVAVTIYPNDLAMVTETRTVDLPKGRSKIVLKGVSDRLIPQTAILTEFGAVSIERNFDFDLLSKGALFSEAVGEEVTLHRTYPNTGEVKVERATIVSGDNGVVLKTEDGLEAFQCSNLSEVVKFDALPPHFQSEPTLSLVVNAKKAGPQTFTFRYLASGFNWKADYVMSVGSGEGSSLIGWLTADNQTRVSFYNADLSYIAGQLNRDRTTQTETIEAKPFFANCIPAMMPPTRHNAVGRSTVVVTASRRDSFADEAASSISAEMQAPIAAQEDVGDYKLYRFPLPVDLLAAQNKQLLFLDEDKVDVAKSYAFDFANPSRRRPYLDDGDGSIIHHATKRYKIDNDKDGELAKPLPAGQVRVVTARETGGNYFIGSNQIKDTPIGGKVHVDAVFANSVAMQSTGTFTPTNGERSSYSGVFDLEYQFMNINPEPVASEFHLPLRNDEKLINTSHPPASDDVTKRWFFTIPAGATHTIKLSVERNGG